MNWFLSLWLVIVGGVWSAHSEGAKINCLLSRSESIKFVPEEVLALVATDREVSLVRGTMIPLNDQRWRIGSVVPYNPLIRKVGFLIYGAGGEVLPLSFEEVNLSDAKFCAPLEELLVAITTARSKVKEDEALAYKTEKDLKRIQADVDLVADIGEIVDLKQSRISAEKQIEALVRDKEMLQKAFQLVRTQPNPKNFLRRESELNQSIPELADIAAQAERSERLRALQAQGGLKKKMDAIQAAQGKDPAMLEEKLIGLRKYRAELERSAGVIPQ